MRARGWLLAAAQAALIFGLSSRPGDEFPEVSLPGADKVVHFALYAPLGGALCLALGGAAWPAAAGAALYGVSDEVHQMFVPRRTPDVGDVAADALGGLAGALAVRRWRRRRAGALR